MKILFISSSRADKIMIECIYQATRYVGIKSEICYTDSNIHHHIFDNNKPEYIFVLGDRWEIAHICIDAVKNGIKVIHQGGGEVSNGSYDNIFRDLITRMASIHFVINEKCKEIINCKFDHTKNHTYICGSPRMDYVRYRKFPNKEIVYLKYNFDVNIKTALIIYHPSTLIEEDHNELISALKESKLQIIVIGANIDKGSNKINSDFKRNFINWREELSHEEYSDLLNCVDIMIGNSSAGISEAPSYKLPVVNVGHRQDGREKLNNIIDCPCEKNEILKAIQIGLNKDFKYKIKENKFSDGKASQRIAEILKKLI